MPEMHVCCVPGCYNRRDTPGKRFFLVPTVETRREQWLRFIGKGVRITRHTRVCCAHFTPDDYHGSGHLKRQAIPTIPASSSITRHGSFFEGSSAVNLIGNGESPSNSAGEDFPDDGCMEVVTNQALDERSLMDHVKQELCRVCGSKDKSLISIFENSSEENTHFSLVKLLEMYLRLKIQDDDNLPSKICSKCSCMVKQWHELYITCVAADKTFRSMFCPGKLEGDRGEPFTRLADEVVHFTICNESSMEDPILEIKENVNENDNLGRSKSDGNVGNNCDFPKDISSSTVINGYFSTNESDGNISDTSEDVTFDTISGEERIKLPEIHRYLFPLFSCRYCHHLFDDRTSWRSHAEACKESLTICEECGKIIYRKYLQSHKCQYHSAKKLCDKCGESFYPGFLSSHLRTHHSETYYCDLCWKIFKTKHGHEYHVMKHQKGVIKTAYKVNTLQKNDKISFVCPVCNLNFDDKLSLIIHLNKSKRVTCPVCKSKLGTEKLFYRHKCKKLYCQHCFRSFYSKARLLGHERTHTGEAPYKCNICDLSFKTAVVRSAHRKTVHGDPTHKCTYCPKKYYLASHLRYHMDIHEGIRFRCLLCENFFNSSDTLRKHIRLHKMGQI